MKVVIIGGNAGGASTAARLRRLDEQAEIVIFERGESVSFASCGIPYFVGDVIKERSELEILTPKQLKELLNIDVFVQNEVLKINRNDKTVLVKNLQTDDLYTVAYDKLVVAPGSSPFVPNIEGIKNDRVFTVRDLNDASKIKEVLTVNKASKAAVIGAGFIGLEMVENFAHLGLDVTLIEMAPQVLNNIDPEMACQLENNMRKHGVNILLEEFVESFEVAEQLKIQLNSGEEIEVDFAILSIGVKSENQLIQAAELQVGKSGGIVVDKNLKTNDQDIYALGDAIEVEDFTTKQNCMIPLAGPANKQGRLVAENIFGKKSEYKATQGTAILKLFDLTAGVTGSNEKVLKRNNIPYKKVYMQGFSSASYYPDYGPISIKLLFAPEDGKILGAQVVGKKSVDKRIDVIATVMKLGGTINDLVDLELAYSPQYGSAKDILNITGMVAQNIQEGLANPIYWDEVKNLDKNTFILDVRSDEDIEKFSGGLERSIRIPIEQLRARLNEIPKDKPIITYCTKGLKSYFASRILMQNGFKDVKSLNGGYMILAHNNKSIKAEKKEVGKV